MKFLIKHNFRREDRYAIAEELKSVCKNVKHPREGKTVYIGSTWRNFETKKDGKFAIRIVYEITERTTSADGQEMLFLETEIDMYWTSLGVSDEEVIELYHNHAVCEQYHSEIKTDMDIERLPSGKFETNALILKLTMISYNILRIIGTAAMKGNDMPVRQSTIKRRRIRTVIDNLILIAGHLTDHARKLRLALGHCNGWICSFLRVAESF
ncbi:MAG: transposase [Ruminococcus flavefaciens]